LNEAPPDTCTEKVDTNEEEAVNVSGKEKFNPLSKKPSNDKTAEREPLKEETTSTADKKGPITTSERLDEIRKEARRPASKETHTMRGPMIGKVVVNITTGQSGEPLDKAMTILENITGQKPCTRRAKQTIRTFNIRRKEPISCMVTLRGERAVGFLEKAFAAVGSRINQHSFDREGNFAFGIKEHIDIPSQRYDPNLGIIGMDVMATVERPGFRVARRRRGRSKVGRSHRVTREESIEFIKRRFGVEVGPPVE